MNALQDCCAIIGNNELALGCLDLREIRMRFDCLQAIKEALRTILSIPLGPNDVRTASLIAIYASCQTMRTTKIGGYLAIPFAATMLDRRTSMGLPWYFVQWIVL